MKEIIIASGNKGKIKNNIILFTKNVKISLSNSKNYDRIGVL